MFLLSGAVKVWSSKVREERTGFSILHDSDDSENRMSRLSEGRGNDWKEAPVEGVMSKENVNIAGKWTGEHVRCYEDDIKLYGS